MSDQIEKNSGGRPPERDEPKRAAIAVRTTPTIKEMLSVSADTGGRSITQEVERRLEESFEIDQLFRDPETKALLITLAGQIARVEKVTGKPWHGDTSTHRAASILVAEAFRAARPQPKNWIVGQRLQEDYEKTKERYEFLTTALMESSVIADSRSALLALDPNSSPIWKHQGEDEWHFPGRPEQQLTASERGLMEEMLAEWDHLPGILRNLWTDIEATVGPHWAAMKEGDDIAKRLREDN